MPDPDAHLGADADADVDVDRDDDPDTDTDRSVSDHVRIAAPPAVVFDIIADPRQHPRIDGSGSLRDVVTGPERLTAGARFAVTMRMFGVPYRIHNRVVEFEPDRRIAWRHFGAHRWRYELEPTPDGGTLVTETFDYSRYRGPAAAGLRMAGFPERNRSGITATLARLRVAAESDAR
jgi:uncharacterized protein YndB with AHSA1/START domain